MDDPNHFLDRNQTHSLVMGPFRYNHREIDTVFHSVRILEQCDTLLYTVLINQTYAVFQVLIRTAL